jgi:hypothetical protein
VVQFTTHLCSFFGCRAVERQHGQGSEQAPDRVTSLVFSRPAQKLEAVDSSRLEPLSIGVTRNLILDRLDSGESPRALPKLTCCPAQLVGILLRD